MPRPKVTHPTPAEAHCLKFLYEHGPATGREYYEETEGRHGRAYTSLMSLMNVMYEKGQLSRTLEKRAFRYTPLITQAEMRTAILEAVLEKWLWRRRGSAQVRGRRPEAAKEEGVICSAVASSSGTCRRPEKAERFRLALRQ